MSPLQATAMLVLAELKGRQMMTVPELASRTGGTPTGTPQTMSNLITKGWVERTRYRGTVYYALTVTGRQHLDDARVALR